MELHNERNDILCIHYIMIQFITFFKVKKKFIPKNTNTLDKKHTVLHRNNHSKKL